MIPVGTLCYIKSPIYLYGHGRRRRHWDQHRLCTVTAIGGTCFGECPGHDCLIEFPDGVFGCSMFSELIPITPPGAEEKTPHREEIPA